MNEDTNNFSNTHLDNDTNVSDAQQSSNNNSSNSTGDSNSGMSVSSTIEQQAYKELYDEQKKQIEALKKEINQIKLANQKLAIQQTTGAPKMSAEELINKMFN